MTRTASHFRNLRIWVIFLKCHHFGRKACENQLSFIQILVTKPCSPFMDKEMYWVFCCCCLVLGFVCCFFFFNHLLCLFLILIIMNLGVFRRSGDLKWLNVFQLSNTEVVDSKASIATSLFLKTFSLRGETSRRKARAMSLC